MVLAMKLFLVEDDPSMQAALQRTLSRRGIEVSVCGDGLQALAPGEAAPPTRAEELSKLKDSGQQQRRGGRRGG